MSVLFTFSTLDIVFQKVSASNDAICFYGEPKRWYWSEKSNLNGWCFCCFASNNAPNTIIKIINYSPCLKKLPNWYKYKIKLQLELDPIREYHLTKRRTNKIDQVLSATGDQPKREPPKQYCSSLSRPLGKITLTKHVAVLQKSCYYTFIMVYSLKLMYYYILLNKYQLTKSAFKCCSSNHTHLKRNNNYYKTIIHNLLNWDNKSIHHILFMNTAFGKKKNSS